MIKKIVISPNPALKEKSLKISQIDEGVFQIAQDLIETQKAYFGIGLSAPQIGIKKRIIVVGDGKKIPISILANPKVSPLSNSLVEKEEGCLSLPGIQAKVPRFKDIEVEAIKLDLKKKNSKKVKFSASGMKAQVIQHEVDHLDGMLFLDKVKDLSSIKQVPVPYKIVFFGTSEFSIPILEELIKSGFGISAVITEPSKPAGRKQKLTPPPVAKYAENHNLLFYQPKNILDLKPSLLNLIPDLIIVAAYGQILPKEILKIPKYGCLCVHPSLLPKYRGPSPIQFAILNGEKETGVTIFKMDEKIDHGPIISQKAGIKIEENETHESLSKKLAKESADLLIKTLPLYLKKKIKTRPQENKKASYTRLLKKEDGYVSLAELQNPKSSEKLKEIERKIRAFYPWPRVWTKIGEKRILIHKAHIKIMGKNKELELDIVQPEGKKPMPYKEYLKGNPKII